MQTGLQPLQQQCGIALLPSRSTRRTATLLRRVQAFNARSSRVSIRCCSSDTETQQQPNFPARTLLGLALAATLSIGSLTSTQAALAKTNQVKKADPYEVPRLNSRRSHAVLIVVTELLNHGSSFHTGPPENHQFSGWQQHYVLV